MPVCPARKPCSVISAHEKSPACTFVHTRLRSVLYVIVTQDLLRRIYRITSDIVLSLFLYSGFLCIFFVSSSDFCCTFPVLLSYRTRTCRQTLPEQFKNISQAKGRLLIDFTVQSTLWMKDSHSLLSITGDQGFFHCTCRPAFGSGA